jgi:type I site-specific restriction-modification system R (restriction) subunit
VTILVNGLPLVQIELKKRGVGIIWLRPIHGEIKAVFIAFSGIGEIAAICPVRNHEYL